VRSRQLAELRHSRNKSILHSNLTCVQWHFLRGPVRHFVPICFFYGEELLAPRPTLPLVGCPRLHIQYTRSYALYLEAVSFIRDLRTRHGVVTGDPLLSRHQNAGQNHNIDIAKRSFENVAKFKCLGTTASNQNLIQEEIKRRLNSGNICYHSVQNLLSSSQLYKNVKIII
jgi:hypothetical protein